MFYLLEKLRNVVISYSPIPCSPRSAPPSSVECIETKLECITSTLHQGKRGEEKLLILTSYYVSVSRALTRFVAERHKLEATIY